MSGDRRWKKEMPRRLWAALGVLLLAAFCLAAVTESAALLEKRERKRILAGKGQIEMLVLGDSIWDLERGETGIAALLEQELGNAAVYNCAIKGSRASGSSLYQQNKAFQEAERADMGEDDAICLYAMAEYIAGRRRMELPTETEAARLLGQIDFDGIDYILLAYGLNDYFGAVQRKNPDDCYDISTYGGALCSSIELLRESCQDAEFVILSPTYCQGYSYGQVIHESDSYDYGGGTGPDYVATARETADAYDVLFVDNDKDLGISIHNGAAYLQDATHLTEKGRRAYAENLASRLLEYWEKEERNG